MIMEVIHGFFARPEIEAVINKIEFAQVQSFNHSIDGLIVGLAVGVFAAACVIYQSGKDKDSSNGLGWALLTGGAFVGSIVVMTVAFGVYGFAKGILC